MDFTGGCCPVHHRRTFFFLTKNVIANIICCLQSECTVICNRRRRYICWPWPFQHQGHSDQLQQCLVLQPEEIPGERCRHLVQIYPRYKQLELQIRFFDMS